MGISSCSCIVQALSILSFAPLPRGLKHSFSQLGGEYATILWGGVYVIHVIANDSTCSFGGGIEGGIIESRSDEHIFNGASAYGGASNAEIGDMRRQAVII